MVVGDDCDDDDNSIDGDIAANINEEDIGSMSNSQYNHSKRLIAALKLLRTYSGIDSFNAIYVYSLLFGHFYESMYYFE